MKEATFPFDITVFHNITIDHIQAQTKIKNTVIVTQGMLMAIAVFLTIRIIFIRKKSRLFILTLLMIIEGIFSIVAAECT